MITAINSGYTPYSGKLQIDAGSYSGALSYDPNFMSKSSGTQLSSNGFSNAINSAQNNYVAQASSSLPPAHQTSSVKLGEKSASLLNNLTADTLQKAIQNPKDFKNERKEITAQVYADLKSAGVKRDNGKDLRLKDVENAQKDAGNDAKKVLKDGQKAQEKIDKAQKKIDEKTAKGEAPEAKHLRTVNDASLQAKVKGMHDSAEKAFLNKLSSKFNVSADKTLEVYGLQRFAFLDAVETGEALTRKGFFGGLVFKVLRVAGIAAASFFGGPLAGAAVAAGTKAIAGAATGQKFGDIVKGAVLEGATAYGGAALGGVVSNAVTGGAAAATTASATTKTLANIAGNAASGASTNVAQTLAYGGNFGDIAKSLAVGALTAAAGSKGFQGTIGNLIGGGAAGAAAGSAASYVAKTAIPSIAYGNGNFGNLLVGGVQAAGQGYLSHATSPNNANNNNAATTPTTQSYNPFTYSRA